MAVESGGRRSIINVVEKDGTVAPLQHEDGASKLLQGMLLAGVRRGDDQLRARLNFAGRPRHHGVFRFPLLGACEALASLGLIYTRECDSGAAVEPVVLAEWDHKWGYRSGAKLTYHQPTERLAFWIFQGYKSQWDFARHTKEWPILPGHYSWREVGAHGDRRPLDALVGRGERRFEPERGLSSDTRYFVVSDDGTVRGTFDDEYYDGRASYLAPNPMDVGRRLADQPPN